MRFSLVLASVAALASAQIDPLTVTSLNAAQVRVNYWHLNPYWMAAKANANDSLQPISKLSSR
jgi:hypothetical protein